MGQSDVRAREGLPTRPARGWLLPTFVPIFHHRERTRTSTTSLSAQDDWAKCNRVHAMYFTRLANNTCGKGELINWRLGGFPSLGRQQWSVGLSTSDLQRHSHRATQQIRLHKNELTDSENGRHVRQTRGPRPVVGRSDQTVWETRVQTRNLIQAR